MIGPNLDDAFRQSRIDGLGEATIRSVVRGQIDYPIEAPNTGSPGCRPTCSRARTPTRSRRMSPQSLGCPPAAAEPRPAAARPPAVGGGEGEAPDGEAIFAEAGCGGCHTLEAAGTSGTVGPNLDDSKPDKELVIDRVTNGQGAMPAFKDSYSPEQIEAVADYVVASTGG